MVPGLANLCNLLHNVSEVLLRGLLPNNLEQFVNKLSMYNRSDMNNCEQTRYGELSVFYQH